MGKCHCDYIIDYTQGDSFTDIYGQWRFYYFSAVKKKIIKKRIPLVLGSQTIGPFVDNDVKAYAKNIIESCEKIFVRDKLSYKYVVDSFEIEPILVTDVALILPYNRLKIPCEKKKIGINVSGLLWNKEKITNCGFDLKVDYKTYCRKLISGLLGTGLYEVFLIVHVADLNSEYIDNDWPIMLKLHTEYPETVKFPFFETPMDAKSYIFAMDVFIGARMHAAIAAFSAGVPVIPFFYSRKFEGLFDSLEYKYLIHGTEVDLESALRQTLYYKNTYFNECYFMYCEETELELNLKKKGLRRILIKEPIVVHNQEEGKKFKIYRSTDCFRERSEIEYSIRNLKTKAILLQIIYLLGNINPYVRKVRREAEKIYYREIV